MIEMHSRVFCPLVRPVLLLCAAAAALNIASVSLQGANATLAWDASVSPNISSYSLHYGTTSRTYSSHIDVGNRLTGTVSNLVVGTRYYFAVTAENNLGLESDWSSEVSYTPTSSSPTNLPPTLNIPNNLVLNAGAGQQTVTLTGIGSGSPAEVQTLTVTASHNNSALLGPITVTYTSPNTNGTLRFTPVAGAAGAATVSVTVNDGGAVNSTITRTFAVSVNAGGGSTIFVEAESGVLAAPMASTSDAAAWGGRGVYSTVANQGTAAYTLNISTAGNYRVLCRLRSDNSGTDSFYVAMDGGIEDVFHTIPDGVFSTSWQWETLRGEVAGDPRIFTLSAGLHTLVFRGREAYTRLDSFFVTSDSSFVPPANPPSPPSSGNQAPTLNAIADITINEDSPQQTVNLSGIGSGSASESQTLIVSASSSNPSLVPTPQITYTSPNTTGTLRFTPVANGSGTTTITVTVNDGQATNNTVQRNFVVTVLEVNDAPVANAGPDASVTLPALLNLSGTATDDGLPNPPGRLSYSWSKVTGPGTVLFGVVTNLLTTVTFAAPGQYVLRLTVSDGALSTSDDKVVTVTGLLDVAGPVISGQVLEALDVRSFTMAWQTDEPARCQVEFGLTTSLGTATTLESAATTNHRVTFTNLNADTLYYYRIRSTDQSGNPSLTVTAPVSTPPAYISAFAAEAGTLTSPMAAGADDAAMDGHYIVSSTPNSGSAGFPIYVRALSTYRVWCRVWAPSAGAGSFFVSVDGGTEDVFDVAETGWRNGWMWVALNGRGGSTPLTVSPRTFLLPLGPHQFTIRALETPTRLDELILSNDPQWTPVIQGPAPVLTATMVPTNQVRLTWTDAIADEDGFRIEVSDGSGYQELATLPANTTNYIQTGVTGGAARSYRIYAFNDSDRTDFSNVATASLGQAPAGPSEFKATRPGGRGPVILNWRDNSTDETGFVLERSRDGVAFTTLQTLGANVITTSDPNPPRGYLYYRIRAYNAWGSSGFSSVVRIRVR